MKKILKLMQGELFRIVCGSCFFLAALVIEKLKFELISIIFYVIALLLAGGAVFISAIRGIIRRDLLDEKFLMSVAAVGAMFLGDERGEGVAVMLFFLIGEYFEHKAVASSRKSIKSLMKIRPDEAKIFVNGEIMTVDAEDVEVGSTVLIMPGERVPIDSVVISGAAELDTSAITGESIPAAVQAGDEILSGSIVLDAKITVRTVRSAEQSSAQRILELVENANERKSRAESFITAFSHYYTPIIVGLAVLFAVVPPILSVFSWQESLYRALTFLVISCPCALVISIPMAFFGGIGSAAKQGILYKGGNTFSALARAETFAFDKTGTLTNGSFEIKDVYAQGVSEQRLLSIAAGIECESNHPIARCLKSASSSPAKMGEITEHAGRGVSSFFEGKRVLLGNELLLNENGICVPKNHIRAGAVYIAYGENFIGAITVRDSVKDEAYKAISNLRDLGVRRMVMLSGDRRENAECVGSELKFDRVYSELLPENKYLILEEIINSSNKTVYVGDGINDAPSIARADVGIAMGAVGTDAAIEAADVVIMSDNLTKLAQARRIAARTVRISTQNIVFAIGIKLSVLVLSAFGITNMWLAVFADVGVAVLAILNSMRSQLRFRR